MQRAVQRAVRLRLLRTPLTLHCTLCPASRIKQSTDFVPGYSLDLGAEYVHGPGTILAGLVETQGWPVRHVFTWAMVRARAITPHTAVARLTEAAPQGDGGPATMPAPDSGVGMYYVGRERRCVLPLPSASLAPY